MNHTGTSKNRMIFGGILLAAGIAAVIWGFLLAGNDNRLYLLLEAAGAVLILVGMTPLIRHMQEKSGSAAGESFADRLQKKMQDQIDAMTGGQNGNPQGVGGQAQTGGVAGSESTGFHPAAGWIMADVIGITRNLRGSSNEQVEYHVMCRYYDGVTHTYQTFTSKALKEYPGKDIIGKRVRVTFHSSDPGDYTVDLNHIES